MTGAPTERPKYAYRMHLKSSRNFSPAGGFMVTACDRWQQRYAIADTLEDVDCEECKKAAMQQLIEVLTK